MDRSDDELSGVTDELLLAAPEVEPPAGFEDRVLERIQGERRPVRAPRRVPLWTAAAAAAVFLVVGMIGGLVIGRSTGEDGGAGQAFRTVELISASGADIGDVSTYAGPPAWFYMRLDGEVPDATYRCVLEMDDGRTVPIGRLWVADGHGGWGEHADVDPRDVKLVRVLDRQGTTIATASFG